MREGRWKRMIEVENEKDMNDLDIGEYFLYGQAVLNQKQSKKPGDQISYYQVVSKNGNFVQYIPVFDILESDIGGEEKEN